MGGMQTFPFIRGGEMGYTWGQYLTSATTGRKYLALILAILEGTACYAGLLIAPVEGFGQGLFCPLGTKRAFHAVCVWFRPFLVFSSNLLIFSSNLSTLILKLKLKK